MVVGTREQMPYSAPLWRVTAALDPNTTVLELMNVWAVRIDPRKSENFLIFSRSIARRLRIADQGGDSNGSRSSSNSSNIKHAPIYRNGNSNGSSSGVYDDNDDDDSYEESEDDEDESMRHLRVFQRCDEDNRGLHALICRVEDAPSKEKVIALLKTVDVVHDGKEPEPFQVQVPRYPAPSRNRLPEWKAYWPVSVTAGKYINALIRPTLSGNSQVSSSNVPGVVDRQADSLLWNETARTWARRNFQKCLSNAWEAQQKGELGVGVHVTSSYPEGDEVFTGVAENLTSIEIGAFDTRVSERNPIKHAVTNAIRDVAKERSERDLERLMALNAAKANGVEVVSGSKHPSHRPELGTAAATAAALAAAATAAAANGHSTGNGKNSSPGGTPSTPTRVSAGQDYLLNNLSLFTTHEPCVSCCMALVHSRVRAVFFINPSPGSGGCCGSGLEEERRCTKCEDGGPYAVQEQAGLNHRFDVWRWIGDDNELLEDARAAAAAAATGESNDVPIGNVRIGVLGLDA